MTTTYAAHRTATLFGALALGLFGHELRAQNEFSSAFETSSEVCPQSDGRDGCWGINQEHVDACAREDLGLVGLSQEYHGPTWAEQLSGLGEHDGGSAHEPCDRIAKSCKYACGGPVAVLCECADRSQYGPLDPWPDGPEFSMQSTRTTDSGFETDEAGIQYLHTNTAQAAGRFG